MSEDRGVLAPSAVEGDAADRALRPLRLRDFEGQEEAKANLEVFVAASRKRGGAMDHTILYGPPGLGKTTLANIIARELGVNFRLTSGPIIAKAGDLAAVLTSLDENDVLFIDEVHRLNPAVEEILYPAMEDRALDLMIGEGPGARSVRIDLAPFTLVAATTRLGLLTTPLRDRFGIQIRLAFYDPETLARIIGRNAGKLGLGISTTAAMEIARRSRGTPRIAGRLLRRVADFAEVAGLAEIGEDIACVALDRLGVDSAGLDGQDRRLLRTIAESYGGGPVGIETLSAALSETCDGLTEVVEPYLMQAGFLERTPRGRVLSARGWGHLGLTRRQHGKSLDLFSDAAA